MPEGLEVGWRSYISVGLDVHCRCGWYRPFSQALSLSRFSFKLEISRLD